MTSQVVRTSLPLSVTEVTSTALASGSQDHGEDKPTFILLHGYGGSSYTWHAWTPRLALFGRVISVDFMGFGDAPKPADGTYTPAEQARLVKELVGEMDLGRITLIGHSMGGGIALLSTLMLIDQGALPVDRLVLVAAAAMRQPLPPFVAMARYPRLSRLMLRVVGAQRVIGVALKQIVHDPDSITREQIETYARPLKEHGGARAALAMGKEILPDDIDQITGRYPEITIPTLLLWGEHDRVIPLWVAKRLEEAMPNAELTVLEACGHIPPEELPEKSWEAVEHFLARYP